MRDWNTVKVTNMDNLLNGIHSFNIDISGWDVSNVTSMKGMFQNTGNHHTTRRTFNPGQIFEKWNTNALENASFMFDRARWIGKVSYNGLFNWHVQNVTNFESMFAGLPIAFDGSYIDGETGDIHDFAKWANRIQWNNVTSVKNMFNGSSGLGRVRQWNLPVWTFAIQNSTGLVSEPSNRLGLFEGTNIIQVFRMHESFYEFENTMEMSENGKFVRLKIYVSTDTDNATHVKEKIRYTFRITEQNIQFSRDNNTWTVTEGAVKINKHDDDRDCITIDIVVQTFIMDNNNEAKLILDITTEYPNTDTEKPPITLSTTQPTLSICKTTVEKLHTYTACTSTL